MCLHNKKESKMKIKKNSDQDYWVRYGEKKGGWEAVIIKIIIPHLFIAYNSTYNNNRGRTPGVILLF